MRSLKGVPVIFSAKIISGSLFFLFSLISVSAYAVLDFSSDSSRLVFDCDITRVKLVNINSIFGWEQNSIVEIFGNNTPIDWVESYTNGVELGAGRICPQLGALGTDTELTVQNSNAIIAKCEQIKNNSDALLFCCKNNSNALLFCCNNYSNAIIKEAVDIRVNSNAFLYCCKNNSNAIVKESVDIRVNSNAFLYCCKNNSNAIVYIVETTVELAKQNSSAILKEKDEIKDNSNALLYCCKNNSEALLQCCRVHSNALLYGIKNNSNALIYGITNNSNALLYCCRVNSNALISGITNNSNALIYGIKNNSNALIYGIKNNSNSLLYCCRVNSNALIYGIKNNSNALIYGITNNSNALIYGITNNSNALLYCCRINSNAIVKLRADLSTIDALVPNIDICGSPYDLLFDLWITQDNILTVKNCSISCVTIDGRGHYIHFSRNTPGIFIIEPDLCVVTKNVVLKDFSDKIIQIHSNSKLVFGEGTVVELADCEALERDWEFEGESHLSGFGNEVVLGPWSIRARPSSSVTLHDVCFNGVRDNNIRSMSDDSTIVLKDAALGLTEDFSYTSGALEFKKNVVITGTAEFSYESDQTSTIHSLSTLFIDKNATLAYEPRSSSRDLLSMEDESARLVLYGCNLNITNTALRLTRGTICVDHDVHVFQTDLFNYSGSVSEFLAFGDGDEDHDVILELLPGSQLVIEEPAGLSYENVDA